MEIDLINKLNPCLKCGSIKVTEYIRIDGDKYDNPDYCIICNQCGYMVIALSKEEVIDTWNKGI